MKKYFTEALLITNNNNKYAIFDWLYWHINIVKFDHIVLIDNNSKYNLESICKLFGNNVTYKKINNNISQSEIYTEYVNNSESWWVLPIDDDEFFYVSDKYDNNVNTMLYNYAKTYSNTYKFSFNWVMMFSKDLYKSVDLKSDYFNLYNYTYNTNFINRNNKIMTNEFLNHNKTIVNTLLKHLYIKDTEKTIKVTAKTVNLKDKINFLNGFDKLGSVHNPITMFNSKFKHAYNTSDECENIGFFRTKPLNYDTDALIFHFKYRTSDEWNFKTMNRSKFTDLYATYDFDYSPNIIKNIYSYKNMFKECNIGKNLYNKYKTKIDDLKSTL